MDLISKYRIIGASIWLGLLIIIVPSWYNDPVNFQPDGLMQSSEKSSLPMIDQPFRLPAAAINPKTDSQQQLEAIQNDLKAVAASEESVAKQKALEQLSQTLQALNQPQTVESAEDKDVVDENQAKMGQAAAENIPSSSQTENANSGQVSSADSKQQSQQWLLRLSSFKDAKEANELLGRLDLWGYNAKIKYFEKSKVYSVRTGPYFSRAKADKDKAKLDKMLRTNGVVVEIR